MSEPESQPDGSARRPTGGAPRIRRRTLIVGGAAGVGAAALGVGGWAAFVRKPALPDLDAAGLSANAQQLVRTLHAQIRGLRIDGEAFVSWVEARQRYYGEIDAPPERLPHRTVQSMILSTDFFTKGAERFRIARFQAYYDPHKNPCYNPLRGT